MLQRDSDHINLWRSELQLEQEARTAERRQAKASAESREAELLRMRQELSDMRGALKADLDARPVASVEKWYQGLEIQTALQEKEQAYRSRDNALSIIWNLDKLHHDHPSKDHYCSCDKRTSQCEEWKVLERTRAFLYKWEDQQVQRLKKDLPHGLPDDHPEVLKLGRRDSWRYGR